MEVLRRIRLFHFTDARNLEGIRAEGGLYSTYKLRELKREFHSGGDELSLELDRKAGMDRYVHLCLKDKYPMKQKVRERKPGVKLVTLVVDRRVLDFPGVRYSTGIAYGQGVEVLSLDEACERKLIDVEVLYGWLPWGEPEVQTRLKKAEKAEILVPDFVPMSLLRFPNG